MKNDLTFSGKLPVVINKTGDARDVFNPMNTTSCDISIVSNKILSDLYTKDKQEIKVKVEKISTSSTTTLFEGYMTPNTYSQRLSPNLDNIDMTCIDPIAMLKYIYIDDAFQKAKTITIGQLIATALAAVKIDINEIWIEDSVLYDGSVKFADMKVQTSNFWDEGGDACTMYDALSECLRLFGYKLALMNDYYVVYLAIANNTFASGYREFSQYLIEESGTLSFKNNRTKSNTSMKFQHSEGDWITIDDNPTMSIEDIYDRIESVASTKIPNLSGNAFDTVTSEDRDKYDAGDLNIQCNKVKGYNAKDELITDDEWYYIWNGVYLAPEFGLEVSDVTINGYANINNAYKYLSGNTGHPTAYGGLLNFYGGEKNLTGTGKDQVNERPIEVKECITVFAPDNGTVPEFLERSDLNFSLKAILNDEEGAIDGTYKEATLTKLNSSASKYGVNKAGVGERVCYKQIYENVTITKEQIRVFSLDLSQSYTRTGINQSFEISNYPDVEDKVFDLVPQDDGENYNGDKAMINRGTAYTYPRTWQSSAITVNSDYFNKYTTSGSVGQDETDVRRILPVWDKRKVVILITLPDGNKYQFNGKEWLLNPVDVSQSAFKLCKIMNGEKIFDSDFQYDLIECSDGYVYSLNSEGVSFMEDADGRIVFNEKNKKSTLKYDYYGKVENAWMQTVESVGVGQLSIILPIIDSLNVLFECYIYNSTLLGMTGNKTNALSQNAADTIRFNITGQAREVNDYGVESLKTLTQYMCDNYNKVEKLTITVNHLPINATYVKAEHLNIDMSLTVPETNLGQMFGESDIRYQTSSRQRFRECYQTPDFKVNTKHQIVGQSDSYLIVGNSFANPDKFVFGAIGKKINCRPENYILQGYHNYFGNLRRVYNRVLVPHKAGFSNFCTYIEVPDLPDTGNGRWLMVVADSNDVKTNRHTITAVEDYGINVDEIHNYAVIEIPRKSRNPLYDLPSVNKK